MPAKMETPHFIKYVFEELNKEGIDTELVQFAGKRSGPYRVGNASNQRTSSVPSKMT